MSLDDVAGEGEPPRRTRKRFTSTQLMMLEHLYHQTSHPTREQREALAREAAMYVNFFIELACIVVQHVFFVFLKRTAQRHRLVSE